MKPMFRLVLLFLAYAPAVAADLPLNRIQMPPGFHIGVYSADVPGARSLALGSRGTVFVSTRDRGAVYALRDTDADGRADKRYVLARNLDVPNGIAFSDGDLYVAEQTRIIKWTGIENRLSDPGDPTVVYAGMPDRASHGWRYLAVGPDHRLYVSIGSPCNVCEPGPGFGIIESLRTDGSDPKVYAKGIRNSVGFDWDPKTGDLWFTDNGRDNLGDNKPPDELNHATHAGEDFGFPYCHAGTIPDPKFGDRHACAEFTPPAMPLGPHVASLGMRFYTGTMFPKRYRNRIFIAEHGSWNRTHKIGYRLTMVTLDDQRRAVAYKPFATGWLQGERAWGRPVDLLVMPDGSLLVSDDYAGAVYRVTYAK